MMHNPYQYLLPVKGESFIGRWEQIYQIASDVAFDTGNSHAIIAGRRCGKSSFLLTLAQHLRNIRETASILPIYFDLKRKKFKSVEDFFMSVLMVLRRYVDKNAVWLSKDAWHDLVDIQDPRFQNLVSSPSLSLDEFEEAVTYILHHLSSPSQPLRIVLLLDEMDETLGYPWTESLYNQLRALVYTQRSLKFCEKN